MFLPHHLNHHKFNQVVLAKSEVISDVCIGTAFVLHIQVMSYLTNLTSKLLTYGVVVFDETMRLTDAVLYDTTGGKS